MVTLFLNFVTSIFPITWLMHQVISTRLEVREDQRLAAQILAGVHGSLAIGETIRDCKKWANGEKAADDCVFSGLASTLATGVAGFR